MKRPPTYRAARLSIDMSMPSREILTSLPGYQYGVSDDAPHFVPGKLKSQPDMRVVASGGSVPSARAEGGVDALARTGAGSDDDEHTVVFLGLDHQANLRSADEAGRSLDASTVIPGTSASSSALERASRSGSLAATGESKAAATRAGGTHAMRRGRSGCHQVAPSGSGELPGSTHSAGDTTTTVVAEGHGGAACTLASPPVAPAAGVASTATVRPSTITLGAPSVLAAGPSPAGSERSIATAVLDLSGDERERHEAALLVLGPAGEPASSPPSEAMGAKPRRLKPLTTPTAAATPTQTRGNCK